MHFVYPLLYCTAEHKENTVGSGRARGKTSYFLFHQLRRRFFAPFIFRQHPIKDVWTVNNGKTLPFQNLFPLSLRCMVEEWLSKSPLRPFKYQVKTAMKGKGWGAGMFKVLGSITNNTDENNEDYFFSYCRTLSVPQKLLRGLRRSGDSSWE